VRTESFVDCLLADIVAPRIYRRNQQHPSGAPVPNSAPGHAVCQQAAQLAAAAPSRPHHKVAPLWSGADSNDSSVPADAQSPQLQFMKQFERVLKLGIDEMRRRLLDAMSCSAKQLDSALSNETAAQCWQLLIEHFLEPMNRLNTFSRVIKACLSPMRQWLSDSVLIGHRSLCLADLIRQVCLENFLKHVARQVAVSIFHEIHAAGRSWETSELQPVHQFVSLLQEYERFQMYLATDGHRICPYDRWQGCSSTEDADAAADSPEQFTVARVLVKPYLHCLEQFYQPKLHPFDSNLVARSVSDWLMTEELLAVSFNVHGFRDAVVSCLLQETVKAHLAELGETVKQLLIDSDSHGLSLFFSVMIMVDGGQEHLLEVIRRFVKDKMLQATSMYIEACVSQLRHCKSIIEATIELQQPSLSRSLLLGTVRAGIADVLNSGGVGPLSSVGSGYPAAALAHHFHRQMRAVRALDAATVEALGDLMTLYSLLEDKESFMLRYHSLLRERLLSEASEQLSLEAETFALDSFTQLSGWKALYELAPVAEAAVREYESRHSGRRVSLVHSFGSGLLAFWPRQRAATDSPALLCRAESDRGVTETQLQLSTGMKQTELAFYLHHLSRAGVLLENSDSSEVQQSEIEDEDRGGGGRRRSRCYAVNDGFDSDAKQVNLMILQQQQAQKQRRRLEKLDQRMKEKKVQCAIVTVMKKQRRQLTKKDLFQLVQEQLQQFTLQTAFFFADQLAYLVAGGYVKFAEDDAAEKTDDSSIIEYIP
uniref:CULLIN_2 domain-containing protein n=1 Tax=Macrostomum lignano TaxID=282301 RepID=A0A1I8FSK9_9PLAT